MSSSISSTRQQPPRSGVLTAYTNDQITTRTATTATTHPPPPSTPPRSCPACPLFRDASERTDTVAAPLDQPVDETLPLNPSIPPYSGLGLAVSPLLCCLFAAIQPPTTPSASPSCILSPPKKDKGGEQQEGKSRDTRTHPQQAHTHRHTHTHARTPHTHAGKSGEIAPLLHISPHLSIHPSHLISSPRTQRFPPALAWSTLSAGLASLALILAHTTYLAADRRTRVLSLLHTPTTPGRRPLSFLSPLPGALFPLPEATKNRRVLPTATLTP